MGPDQFVTDVQWLEEAGRRGEAVFMKDSRIYVNPAERDMVQQFNVRCFCLANRSLTANQMAEWFLNNLDVIATACAAPGLFMYIVYAQGMRRLENRRRED